MTNSIGRSVQIQCSGLLQTALRDTVGRHESARIDTWNQYLSVARFAARGVPMSAPEHGARLLINWS
jgi:hypothetical protein